MTIQVKGKKDTVVTKWKAMVAMAGNDSFTSKEQANVNSRLTRRTVPFHFGQKVADHDRELEQKIMEDMPRIIWMCSWALKV